MLEIREIECLLTLSDNLHFGRTAEHLNISQARVSQVVSSVEKRIGAPLFERSNRHVRLSSLGERLVSRLRPLYTELTHAYEGAVAVAQGFEGTLRLGITDPSLLSVAASVVRSFRERYPTCEVWIVPLRPGELLGSLHSRTTDLALARLPVRDPGLTAGPVVLREPRMLVTGPGHPLAGRPSVSVEELAGETIIRPPDDAAHLWQDLHYPRVTPLGRRLRYRTAAGTGDVWHSLLSELSDDRPVALVPASETPPPTATGLASSPVHDLPLVSAGLLWCTAEENARIRGFARCVPDPDLPGQDPSGRHPSRQDSSGQCHGFAPALRADAADFPAADNPGCPAPGQPIVGECR
ncbi:transcriptional regulator, LysR family [Actinobacteria bacterium OK074]|nr:transcriptional regulator, LysR family [Actinobacteria bacterium OK074]